MEALLLSHEVLGKRCLASAPSHDLVVSHLNVELKLALGIRVLVAHVVIVEHKGLAPGHFRGLMNLDCFMLFGEGLLSNSYLMVVNLTYPFSICGSTFGLGLLVSLPRPPEGARADRGLEETKDCCSSS